MTVTGEHAGNSAMIRDASVPFKLDREKHRDIGDVVRWDGTKDKRTGTVKSGFYL